MTSPSFPERPSTRWRRDRAAEARAVAAGECAAADAVLTELFPDAFLDPLDRLCGAFERDLARLPSPADYDAAFGAVERLVVALNELLERTGEAYIETAEREAICAYIDDALGAAGVDVPAMAASRGMGAAEITDDWREW